MIIVFAGQKGGVGKSTLSVGVSMELMHRGAATLLVDADPQLSSRTWAEVAAAAGHPVPTTVALGATMHEQNQVPRLARAYDHVVIDTPPRHGDVLRSALMVGDVAVIPTGQSGPEIWSLAETAGLVSQARVLRPDLRAYVVLNRTQPQTTLGREARGVLAKIGLDVMHTEVRARIVHQEALGLGRGVTLYAPNDPASDEVRALVDELLAMSTPPTPKAKVSKQGPRPKKGAPRRG